MAGARTGSSSVRPDDAAGLATEETTRPRLIAATFAAAVPLGGYARCVHLAQLMALTVVYSSTTLLDGFVLGRRLGMRWAISCRSATRGPAG